MISACSYYAAFAMQSQQHLYLNQGSSLQIRAPLFKSGLRKSSSFPHPRLKNKEKSEWPTWRGAPFALLFPQRQGFVPNYALSKKGLRSRASGSDKITVQPLPGCEVIDRLAPTSIARSRIPNSPRPLGELSAGTSAC